VPARTMGLVHLRASQINGCSLCVDMHPWLLKKAGETDERLFTPAVWRDALYFTGAVTRLSDRTEPVPDDVWAEAMRHYDEPALAALLLSIGTINVWNRLNVHPASGKARLRAGSPKEATRPVASPIFWRFR